MSIDCGRVTGGEEFGSRGGPWSTNCHAVLDAPVGNS